MVWYKVCVFGGLLLFFSLSLTFGVMAIISIPTKVNGAFERTSGKNEAPGIDSQRKKEKKIIRMFVSVCVCVCTFICSKEHRALNIQMRGYSRF